MSNLTTLKWSISFKGVVEQFPGAGGWLYVVVPKRFQANLRKQRRAWGMYPIEVLIGKTTWKTKLMVKRGGDFFVAIKAEVRKKEEIDVGDSISVTFNLIKITP